jgi:hypothetical protein
VKNNSNNVFFKTYNGQIISSEDYNAIFSIVKVLYRLKVASNDQVTDISLKLKPLFL